MKKQKSIKLNMLLNAANGLMKVVFPLITFPYVSKILGVEGVGQYSFSASVVSYFSLFAGLGIDTYAIREGTKFRDNRDKFSCFVSEIFSINVISSTISYIFLALVLLFTPQLHSYTSIILVLSLQIAFNTVGVEWVFQLQEEFAYITIRSFVFQVLSLGALFLFVRDANAVIVYAMISVCSSVGAKLLNVYNVRKFCRLRFTRRIHWKDHTKPILLLFSTAIAITVFVQSDTTILGLMCGDYSVGLYSVSNKIYTVVKTIMSSVLVVSIPRLSMHFGRNEYDEFTQTASDIYRTLWSLILPATTGMLMLRREIILIISNESYLDAISSFSILSVTLIVCMTAWFWAQCILVPMGFEKVVFKATIFSALVNIVLNLILIPIWKENAAAFTTFLAQAIELIWCYIIARKRVNLALIKSTIVKSLAGCVGIILCTTMLKLWFDGVTYVVLSIAISSAMYFLIEVVVKNIAITGLFRRVMKKA